MGLEENYQLPSSEEDKFQALFETIDEKKEMLMFQSYGISNTKLEEIFIKLTHDSNLINYINIMKEDEDVDNYDFASNKMKSRKEVNKSHFNAIVKKRY